MLSSTINKGNNHYQGVSLTPAKAGFGGRAVYNQHTQSFRGRSVKKVVKTMLEEADNFVKHDKYATPNKIEAILAVPGLHALWAHRIIHKLYEKKVPVVPRVLANLSRMVTGIEIHPGAKIGKNVVIDHTGTIIGQTARIGDNVHIIGRTVLGSTGKGGYYRHTTVEEGAMIGINTTFLGRINIGKNAKVGAGAVVTHDVPAGATVIGNPAVIIAFNDKKLRKPISLKRYHEIQDRKKKVNEAIQSVQQRIKQVTEVFKPNNKQKEVK